MNFILSANTEILYEETVKKDMTEGMKYAADIWKRDRDKVFIGSEEERTEIVLAKKEMPYAEGFEIEVAERITVWAEDDLGFIYGLLYISGHFMGIRPFWFWMDQKITPCLRKEISCGIYRSRKPPVRYRGWFVNDEVLIMRWKIGGDPEEPWRMAFEALLRCGGNMVIPGTDKNSRKYRQLASDMGLWITHHHVEPLGAEMFARAYPELEPDYEEHAELFDGLWRDAVEEQKKMKIIWTLGFRGQGDGPFWGNDRKGRYNTPEKRGRLIERVIRRQRELVEELVENPVFCTNLYGEIMELYAGGYLHLPEDVIKISADNGYGKMVTRRRGNHTARVVSLPKTPEKHGGIYYHVSFYDLQAANHITMLPNSVDFVNRELTQAMEKNAADFWLINCSNVRPHTYFLDAVRRKWSGQEISDEKQSLRFAEEYFGGNRQIAEAYRDYHDAALAFGKEEDEHAGEQFYTENVRLLIHAFINRKEYAPELEWLTGKEPLEEQIQRYAKLCEENREAVEGFRERCEKISTSLEGEEKKLFDGTLFLQVSVLDCCTRAVIAFGKAHESYEKKNMKRAFLLAGSSVEWFECADALLAGAEYGVWKGFYRNECFADISHSAYMVRKYMGVIREAGDDCYHVEWYRDAVYSREDRAITSLFVTDKHMTDWELYEALRRKLYRYFQNDTFPDKSIFLKGSYELES